MKKFCLFAVTLIMTAYLSVFSVAQTSQPQPANKIVIVDTSAFFNDKTGITKIIAASRQLETELAPKRNELQQMANRSQNLQKEIDALQKNVQNKVPIDQKAAQAKVDEMEKLQREGKFKQDEFNKFTEKRQNELLGPPYSEVLKALEGYIRSKGFGMVFDVSKDQGGMLIFATEQNDITKEFIAFYNSRPATSTSSTTPTAPRPTATPTPKPPIKP